MLIINGQVVREGDSPAAGIKILEIRPRSVVLGVQDQTYEWPLPTP
jgi:predicted transcriptional regulator